MHTREQTREQTRKMPLRVRIVRFELAGQLEDDSEGYLLAFAAATATCAYAKPTSTEKLNFVLA